LGNNEFVGGIAANFLNDILKIPFEYFLDRRNGNEEEAIAFLQEFGVIYGGLANAYVLADWAYNTNLTDHNAEAAVREFPKSFFFGVWKFFQGARGGGK